MLFTLEALDARHGDALLLHFGTANDPRLILIDGGPPAVYADRLKPRLLELRAAVTEADDEPIPLDLLMISHIDDDHIGGVLGLTRQLLEQETDGDPRLCDVLALWHNAFEDLVDDDGAVASLASVAGMTASAASASIATAVPGLDLGSAVVASVDQGRRLRDDARALALALNPGFHGLVRRAADVPSSQAMGGGLELVILGPSQNRLDDLKEQWRAVLRARQTASTAAFRAMVAAFLDKSVFNLASIIVLARADGRTMLLTGDARGDDIEAGLEDAGLLADGHVHFDVFKVPHHGSERNVTREFFETVTADHYLVSANGRDGNPDPGMLEMLVDARGNDPYRVHLTNRVPHAVDFLRRAQRNRQFRTTVRRKDSPSVRIDVGDRLPARLRPRRLRS